MPVYNAQDFLIETIDSILNQSNSNWELLAVDDFSTDNSFQILQSFERKDSRIKAFKNAEKGIIPALQLAYIQSNGVLITRMDADDLMPIDKLKYLSEAASSNPNACITAKVEYFSDSILNNGYLRYQNWLNALIDEKSHYDFIYQECIIPSPCWMMPRDLFEKIGGFKSDMYPEDYELCFRLYQYQVPIIGLEKTLHLWRDHQTRASRNDPNYADQRFYDLKLYYFFKLDYRKSHSLILWGAGTSAKLIAKYIADLGIALRWITNNPKKQGHNIYGYILENLEDLKNCMHAQIIIAIKEPDFKETNQELIKTLKEKNEVYFFH